MVRNQISASSYLDLDHRSSKLHVECTEMSEWIAVAVLRDQFYQ